MKACRGVGSPVRGCGCSFCRRLRAPLRAVTEPVATLKRTGSATARPVDPFAAALEEAQTKLRLVIP